jgi:hypothetical protein
MRLNFMPFGTFRVVLRLGEFQLWRHARDALDFGCRSQGGCPKMVACLGQRELRWAVTAIMP